MKVLAISDSFGLENIRFQDRPTPEPGRGQILVHVRAASLNYRDLMMSKGLYNPNLPLPRVLGSDAAGEVTAIGEGVTRFAIGDRVASCFFQDWNDGAITEAAGKSALGGELEGVLAETVVLSEHGAIRIPESLSYEEAATLPCAALTAWNALTDPPLRPGETVLLQGTGGVSIFALQFAKALGATVLITSSHDDKLARALAMGADAGVNYKKTPDWEKWVRQATNGVGVDRVVEVGGAGTLERSAKAVKYGGDIALIGVLAGLGTVNPLLLLMKAITLRGIFVGSRAMFEAMLTFIDEKKLKPVIDRVFPFERSADAFKHLESGGHFGKVVLRIS